MMKVLRKKRKGGFTLIELIVVIAILGILAAIAIPRFAGVLDNAKEKTHNANRQVLISAAQVAVAENGAPAAAVSWATAAAGTAPHVWATYLDSWPTNPLPAGHAQAGVYTVSIAATTGVITVLPAEAP